MSELRKLLGNNLKENENLSSYFTLGTGGNARYFYRASSVPDLIHAVSSCLKLKIPYLVIGSGSNIVFSDAGYSGCVIKNESRNLSFIKDKSQVIADSGVLLPRLILEAASQDLGGLEFLYGIPGSVGGALYTNAGTYGGAIGDFVISLTLLFPNGSVKRVTKKWMFFQYRDSKLRHLDEKPVILSAKFQLSQNRKEEIMRKIQHFQKIRQMKHPTDKSAGSFFKNPKVDRAWAQKYLNFIGEKDTSLRDLIEKSGHIPAGWLLEQAGAKKMKVSAARVSKKHANFIINYKGKAKSEQIKKLAELLKARVNEKFGIQLEEEIEYKGDWQ
jgi:UDP-N-acetylmuramate dehydrogenase